MIFGGSSQILPGDRLVINRTSGQIEFYRSGGLLMLTPPAEDVTEPVDIPELEGRVTVPSAVDYAKRIAEACGLASREQGSDGMSSRFLFVEPGKVSAPTVAQYPAESGR